MKRSHCPKLSVFLQRWMVISLVAALNVVSHGANLLVPQNFPTVRAAYASAVNGDTIVVASGLYLEPPGPFSPTKHVFIVTSGTRAIVSGNTPPANDSFAGRAVLAGSSVQTSAFNYAATAEPGELLRDGSPALRSLWWSWTAPSNGLVVISTVGSEFEAYVDVFTGNAFPPTPVPENQLDFRQANEVSLVVQQGGTYQIAVNASDSGAYGQVVLNIVMPERPENDDFANRFVLGGTATNLGSYTYSAQSEVPTEPNHAGQAAGRSVWFSWTAPTNEPSLARPVSINTLGSDFDTVLAVYTGTALNSLVNVTNDDDIAFDIVASRVTFVPTPGLTYQIAVDGSTKNGSNLPRRRFGNVVLAIDYSLINISVESVTRQATNYDGSITFTANLRLLNPGSESAGPLRLRLLAASGRAPAAVHLAGPEFQTNLAIIPLPPPDSLSPGANRLLTVGGVCPAMINNPPAGYGVFVLLEEQIGSNWVPLDGEFLLYGFFPIGDLVSLGVPIRANVNLPRVNGSQITMEFLVLKGPSSIVEGTTSNVTVYAQLSDDSEVLVGPDEVVWTAPANLAFSPNPTLTNSQFAAAQTGQRLLVTNTCRFVYGGTAYIGRYVLTVYPRPFLALAFPPPHTQVTLRLFGESGKRYVVEAASALCAGCWQPLGTNVVTTTGQWDFTVNGSPQPGQRFYRARQIP